MTRYWKVFWALVLMLGLALMALVCDSRGQPVPKKPKVWKHAEVTQGMGAVDLLAKPVPVPHVREVEFRLARTDYTNVWWALESSLDGRAWLTERETVTELVMTVTNLGEQKKFYRLKGRFHP